MQQRNLIPEFLTGAAAGVVATWPMTVLMEQLDGADLETPNTALPPRDITIEALQQVSGEPPSEAIVRPATKLAHYSYGGAVGSTYPFTAGLACRSKLLGGAAFGLGVWAGSYLGILPALGSSARATNRSPRVNAIMIAAHIFWGVSVAVLCGANQRSADRLRSD